MATIGQTLTAPESGWKRYDDSNPAFKYNGFTNYNSTSMYNATGKLSQAAGSKVSFNFIGTKIRIVSLRSAGASTNVKITIDGVDETFSEYGASDQYMTLLYEKTGLINTVHTIVITTNDTVNVFFDAIDIDSTGRLIHPDEVTDPKDLAVGKRIRAHYMSATSGSVGSFSGLGQETSDFIPVASTDTPNGDFYFLMVDEGNGKQKLIADRNIQNKISWDVLNTAGIASGSGLLVNLLAQETLVDVTQTISSSTPFTKIFDSPVELKAISFVRKTNAGDQGLSEIQVFDENGNNIASQATFELIGPEAGSRTAATVKTNLTDGNTTVYGWDDSTATGENGVKLIFNDTIKVSKFVVYASDTYKFNSLKVDRFYKTNENMALTARLLTGGTSSSDKDNEWDNYIVNSTLGGTITAGDNNVWNWSGVYSWSSTVQSNAGYRVLRGNTAVGTWSGSPSGTASSYGLRPALEIESLVTPSTFNGDVDKTSVHKEDVTLTGTASDQYKVLVNGEQVFPSSGYAQATTPVSVVILNTKLVTGSNNITVEMLGSSGTTTWTKSVSVVNSLPVATLSLDASSVHGENVNLSGNIVDADGDSVSYRILLNSTEVKPWATGGAVNFDVSNALLNVGNNAIVVEYKDDFKGGEVQTWSGTITVINTTPNAVITMTPESVHNENATVTGSITDPETDLISYRILLNGVEKVPFTNPSSSPVDFTYTVNNADLILGANTLKVEFKDNFKSGAKGEWTGTITAVSSAPVFTLVTETPTVGSKGDAVIRGTLEDSDGDKISHRLLVNGVEKFGWSDFTDGPLEVEYTVLSSLLDFGSNAVVIEFKDNYKTGATGNWQGTIEKTDHAPTIEVTVVGMTLRVSINDADADKVQYQIKLNGSKIYPGEGEFTPLEDAPISYVKTFRSSDGIVIGSLNTIDVIAKDEFGFEVTATANFEGVYAGLMFSDLAGNYYSSDLGEVLFYLDLGTIVAGSITPSVPIRLINKNGYKVTNIRLSTDNNTLPAGAWIELSKSESPFLSNNILLFTDEVAYNQEVTFHLRLATNINADPAVGNFRIFVKADPIE